MTEPVDDMTELYDADVPRVDLVGKAANGVPGFLLMKQDATGLLPADYVRDLIKTATPDTTPELVTHDLDNNTVTGSPAAITKMIAAAAQRAKAAAKEHDMPDTDTDVAKADPTKVDVDVNDIIAAAPASSTAESVPGSPDWEQMDGDTALSALAVLGRVKAAVEWLAGREATELVASDGGDECAVWDLEDTASQLDWAISTLAGFAAGEKLDAEVAGEMEQVGKATMDIGGLLVPLGVLESFAPVVKAGRVLSSANEASIRGAVESLQKVLASLPAPIESDLVAKESAMPTEDTELAKAVADRNADADALAAAQSALIEKAKADGMQIVFDAEGNAVGLVDPTKVQPIATGATATDTAAADDTAAPAAEVGTPTDATAPVAAAPAPAPAAAAPAAAAPKPEDVAKSDIEATVASLVKAALDEQSAAHAAIVKGLEDRLADLEAPAPPKTVAKGARPTPEHLRGQDQDAATSTANVDHAAELRKQANDASTPAEQEAARTALNMLATAELQRIQQR